MRTALWGIAAALAGLLASVPAFAVSVRWGLGAWAMFTALAAFLMPRRGRVLIAAGAVLASSATTALAGYGAFGLREPWLAAFAQQPGQTALLVLRVALLALVGMALDDLPRPSPRVRSVILFASGALFLASLAARGLAGVFVLAILFFIAWRGRSASVDTIPRAAPLVLLAAGVVLVVAAERRLPSMTSEPTKPTEPAAAIDVWRARGNLWRARWVAYTLAQAEQPPANAYIALAQCDWDVGRPDVARRVIAKVVAGGAPPETRRRAEELMHGWER